MKDDNKFKKINNILKNKEDLSGSALISLLLAIAFTAIYMKTYVFTKPFYDVNGIKFIPTLIIELLIFIIYLVEANKCLKKKCYTKIIYCSLFIIVIPFIIILGKIVIPNLQYVPNLLAHAFDNMTRLFH